MSRSSLHTEIIATATVPFRDKHCALKRCEGTGEFTWHALHSLQRQKDNAEGI